MTVLCCTLSRTIQSYPTTLLTDQGRCYHQATIVNMSQDTDLFWSQDTILVTQRYCNAALSSRRHQKSRTKPRNVGFHTMMTIHLGLSNQGHRLKNEEQ